MDNIEYFFKKPKDVAKGHKVISQKIDSNYVYFVIKAGNRPSKALTAQLADYFKRQEKQKKDVYRQKMFNIRLAKAALPLW